jgi:hypothetical protein
MHKKPESGEGSKRKQYTISLVNSSGQLPTYPASVSQHLRTYLFITIGTPTERDRNSVAMSETRLIHWRTQEFCSEGVQQTELRTEDREKGDLGAVAP